MSQKKIHYCCLFSCGLFILACQTGNMSDREAPVLNFEADSLTIFGEGLISTHLNERDLTFTSELDEVYYTHSNLVNSMSAILFSRLQNGKWSSPEVVSFSGVWRDIEPFLSPDNSRLYFSSNRPSYEGDDQADYNIWYVDRTEDGWTKATNIGTTINTDQDEYYPSVSVNGNLYFTAAYDVGKGTEDIFMAEWNGESYENPISLDSTVNTSTYEFNAYISPDEQILIFTSYGRPDGLGGGDLYASFKSPEGTWQPAIHLGPEINSSSLDYCPVLNQQQNHLFFTSNRHAPIPSDPQSPLNVHQLTALSTQVLNGLGNLYIIPFEVNQIRNDNN